MSLFSKPAFVSLRSLLRDFARFAGRKGVKAFVFMLLGAFVEGIGIVLLIPFFSVIIGGGTGGGRIQRAVAHVFGVLGVDGRIPQLSLLVLSFAVLMIARAAILAIRDVTTRELEIGFVRQLRMRITHLLASSSWDTVSRLRHSRMTHLMGADIHQVGNAMYILQADGVALIMLLSQIAIAFLLSPPLAAIALCVVLAGTFMAAPMLKRARAYGKFVVDANLSLIDDVNQFLGALKLAIGQNLQSNFMNEFDASLEQLSQREIRYVRQMTLQRLAAVTCAGLAGAAILFLGVTVVRIDPPILMAFLLLMSRMNGPAMQIQRDAQQFAHVLPAYEKIKELETELRGHAPVVEDRLEPAAGSIGGAIEFAHVSFQHRDGRAQAEATRGGIDDICLSIQPGSIVGISGSSGAGKTTFSDLLVGLYRPQQGEVRVDGTALLGQTLVAWRNQIGYAVQDPFLFHDTVRRNLLWANPDAQDSDLWEAMRIACADDVVRRMPQGLETLVGERGTLLSGGERQRLCLARAVLRKPTLLVMDEATSAVDIETERKIFVRLLEIEPRPTMIVIAHRPESLAACERLIVFGGGKILSDGPPR